MQNSCYVQQFQSFLTVANLTSNSAKDLAINFRASFFFSYLLNGKEAKGGRS